MPAVEAYAIILLVYFGTDLIAAWGLNLQYGVTGVVNLAYIVTFAAGAYGYSVLALGSDRANGGYQSYVLGLHLAPPLAIAGGAVFGAAVGGAIGIIGLRGLRPDYQAVASLVVAIIATYVVELANGLFDGNAGLSLVPNPFGGVGSSNDGWQYVAMVAGACALTLLCVRRFTNGPMGRALRAVRMNAPAAQAVGKNVVGLRLMVQVVGGGVAGLGGALLVGFIGAWSPGGWAYAETLALLTAVIVGGYGNNLGIVVGTLLVPVGLLQASQYIPTIANRPGLAEDIGWMLTGTVTVGFIWLRPKGLVPDRRPRHGLDTAVEDRAPAPEAAEGVPLRATPGAVPEPAGSGAVTEPAPLVSVRAGADAAGGGPPGAVGARPIIEARDVVVRYGGTHAVNHLSLAVTEGSVTGLIGPNGAGKSSLLSAMSGFSRVQGGSILFEGHDVTRWSPYRRARRGLVRTFQLAQLFPGLTVAENLLVAATGQRAESTLGVLAGRRYWQQGEAALVERAMHLLERFEIADYRNTPAGSLSGGQKRMVELARAVMMEPKLLLLDEPRAGLSPRWAEVLEQAIEQLNAAGMSFLIVEHELGMIERLCEEVVVMAKGEVLATGRMGDLRDRFEVQQAYVAG